MRSCLVFFFLLAALPACISTKNSNLSHAPHDPVGDANPSLWVSITEDEYNSVLMYGHEKEFDLRCFGLAAPQHPARQRLQSMVDFIDGRLRTLYPQALAAIPKPKAHLVLTSASNAFVYTISVCTDRSGYMQGLAPGKTRYWQFDPTEQTFTADANPQLPLLCVSRNPSDAEVTAQWNAIVRTSDFKLSDRTFVLGPSFRPAFAAETPERADQVVLVQLPNAVTFYSGLLLGNTERSIFFFVAHELAHYYRAHPMLPQTEFGIYYDLRKKNPAQRPHQTADYRDFAQRMEAIRRLMPGGSTRELSAAKKKEWKDLNRQAFEQKIGQYTAEQEADELGLEWILDAGLDRDLPIRALLTELKNQGTSTVRRQTPENEWNSARCEAAFAAGWKDQDDRPVFVPVGDYYDEHHSLCYCAFNLFREIECGISPDRATRFHVIEPRSPADRRDA